MLAAVPPARWTDDDIVENLRQFRLAEQYAALGAERFAYGAFQFVLQRWPEHEVIEAVRRAHVARLFNPDASPGQVLESDERRRRNNRTLPSTFDYHFPFYCPAVVHGS